MESKDYNNALIFALKSITQLGNHLFRFPRLQSAFTLLDECLGTTPLHWAFALGRPQVASCLLHFGADLNIRNENGDTPFEMADKFGTWCLVFERVVFEHEAREFQ